MRRLTLALAAAALALAALSSAGCCAVFCRQTPPPAPPRFSRDTPRDTIRFLVDAIRRHAPVEIYETLHPALIDASGGFSAADFAAAFDYYEKDFRADAERLDRATIGEPFVQDGVTFIHLADGDAGVTLGFVNVPEARIVLDDDYFPEMRSNMPRLARTFEIDGDQLRLAVPIPLQGQGPAIQVGSIKRVEVFNSWLVYDIRNPTGIRIWDVLRNQSGNMKQGNSSR